MGLIQKPTVKARNPPGLIKAVKSLSLSLKKVNSSSFSFAFVSFFSPGPWPWEVWDLFLNAFWWWWWRLGFNYLAVRTCWIIQCASGSSAEASCGQLRDANWRERGNQSPPPPSWHVARRQRCGGLGPNKPWPGPDLACCPGAPIYPWMNNVKVKFIFSQ